MATQSDDTLKLAFSSALKWRYLRNWGYIYQKGRKHFMLLSEQLTHLDNGHTIARYRILYQDCNPQRHVHLHRLMALAQDSDDHSCARFDGKSDDIRERGFCWILLANTFSFTGELPKAEDILVVDTWPRGSRGVRLFRENRYYRNSIDEANFFGAASSEWILCTLNDHRPMRPSSVVDLEKMAMVNDPAVANMENIPRLKSVLDNSDEREVMRYQVQLGGLDTNTHLHSSYYVGLAIDAAGTHLAIDPLKEELVVRKLHIQFVNEAKLFDKLVLYVIPDPENDNRLSVEGRIVDSDAIAFLVKLEYELETCNTPGKD
ncbi:MAG TPA: thioesterase [Bacillota bacterium]|nr:thioesterase [Bacillota bacterium]